MSSTDPVNVSPTQSLVRGSGGQPINLGPFVGGLNNVSHPGQIADDDLQELINFEVDIDGSLRSRPPIQEQIAPVIASRGKIIASGNLGTGIGGYAFASQATGIFRWDGTNWSKITAEPTGPFFGVFYADAGVDYAWFPPANKTGAEQGGRWNPDSGWTFVPALPKANVGCIYKDRLWLAPGITGSYTLGALPTFSAATLFFSDPGDLKTWPAINFIEVNPGDGQSITNLIAIDDNLIIFKERSIYVLGYDVNPADAILRQIANGIGCFTYNSVAEKDGVVYFFDEHDVYEMRDFQFRKLNIKVKFDRGVVNPNFLDDHYLFVHENRLIIRTGANMYAFNLLSQSWSQFSSSNADLNSIGICKPFYRAWSSSDFSNRIQYYIGGTADITGTKMFRWYPEVDTAKEQHGTGGGATVDKITCSARTKSFSFDIFHTFKRLFWWGAEVAGSGSDPNYDHYGQVTIFGFSTAGSTSYRTDFDFPSSSRRFVKLKKALRFRRIDFQISLQTEGDVYARLFNIVPIIRAPKETVVESTTS